MYLNSFRPSTRKSWNGWNATNLDEHAQLPAARLDPIPWRHHFQENSVFTHPREHSKTVFSQISTLEDIFEKMRFRWPFSPDTRGRKAKPAGEKISLVKYQWIRLERRGNGLWTTGCAVHCRFSRWEKWNDWSQVRSSLLRSRYLVAWRDQTTAANETKGPTI